MTEIVCAAGECAHLAMHAWPEAGVTEVLEDDAGKAGPAGYVGRIICTGLLNVDLRLVRYEVGDRGAIAEAGTACSCEPARRVLDRLRTRGLTDMAIDVKVPSEIPVPKSNKHRFVLGRVPTEVLKKKDAVTIESSGAPAAP